MLSIGLMSGTSMDGIDAALLETDGTPLLLKQLGSASLSYDKRFSLILKATECAVRLCQGSLERVDSNYREWLEHYFCANHIDAKKTLSYFPHEELLTYDDIVLHSTDLHAELVFQLLEKLGKNPCDIEVVGYHGQTLYHQPERKCSIIMGDAQHLADQLGIRVISDFRRNDIEAGGQGAPFAPLYHQALAIRDGKIPLAVVNCGGIANITLIPSEKEIDVIGFDTGPGNALVDSLVRKRTEGREQMDKGGQYGKKGTVDQGVLKALFEKAVMKNNQCYFSQTPPKSLDYGDMVLIPELDSLSLEDACATLEAFTAKSIVKSLEKLDCAIPTHWILAGGGWNNPVIHNALVLGLQEHIGPKVTVMTANEAGWDNQALEAEIFAYFAVRSLLDKPLSVPGTTRVPYPLSGGISHFPDRQAG